jgi:hypothetical protein
MNAIRIFVQAVHCGDEVICVENGRELLIQSCSDQDPCDAAMDAAPRAVIRALMEIKRERQVTITWGDKGGLYHGISQQL